MKFTIFILTLVSLISNLKYLRLAQREHYISGYVIKFWLRWLKFNLSYLLLLISIFLIAISGKFFAFAVVAIIINLFLPIGLKFRGTTSKLVWTKRLYTLAAVTKI